MIFFTLSLVIPRNQKQRTIAFLFLPWFGVPLIGFTIYSGPLSDYYFLLTTPFVIYIIAELIEWALGSKVKYLAAIMVLLWGFSIYQKVIPSLSSKGGEGLQSRKQAVLERISEGEIIPYKRGSIESYLYYIYTRPE